MVILQTFSITWQKRSFSIERNSIKLHPPPLLKLICRNKFSAVFPKNRLHPNPLSKVDWIFALYVQRSKKKFSCEDFLIHKFWEWSDNIPKRENSFKYILLKKKPPTYLFFSYSSTLYSIIGEILFKIFRIYWSCKKSVLFLC